MIDFCEVSNSLTGRCEKCLKSYIIYQDKCIFEISNCQIYDTKLISCTTCLDGYFKATNVNCAFLPPRCQKISNLTLQCDTCDQDFVPIMQDNSSICIFPVDKCVRYDIQGKCTVCSKNYVIQYNRCKRVISARCSNLNNDTNTCTSCFSPYLLKSSFCVDPNCQKNDDEDCLACLDGFYILGTNCVRISDPNCASYNGTTKSCINCKINYNVLNGLCVLNVELYNGCQKNEYPCTKCNIGYLLNKTINLCFARKCDSYKSNRDCQKCVSYYKFDPSNKFCVIFTCNNPPCYEADSVPEGFYLDSASNLKILFCIDYSL